MKRTWNPKKKKRMRMHGFLKRMQTLAGQKVIKRRRAHGRKKLSVLISTTQKMRASFNAEILKHSTEKVFYC